MSTFLQTRSVTSILFEKSGYYHTRNRFKTQYAYYVLSEETITFRHVRVSF